MTQSKRMFLLLMRTAMGSAKSRHPAPDDMAWDEVFHLAEQHHVLPMVVDAAYRVYGDEIPWERLMPYKKRAQRMMYLQTLKTERFLSLYRFLSDHGLTPLVMKGLICRRLYPDPDFRFSADEDLLIPPDEALTYHEAFLGYGLRTDSPEQEIVSAQETPYRSVDGMLFLEVHRFAFPPDSGAYGEYNTYLTDVFEHAVTETSAGTGIWTMAPTDHLFYLICHAMKHFLHGGFGIRQVCDIGLFAQAYAGQTDWSRLKEQLDSIHALVFTASLFEIAEQCLGIGLSGVPGELRESGTDPEALLNDILESGVYGSSTMSRKHSSTITLRAAEAAGSGASDKKPSRTRTLFPSVSSMTKDYPYLTKRPWLLPAAWMQRISRYLKSRDGNNTPGEALRIGRERVSLMKEYGLLSGKSVKQVDTSQYLSTLCELIDQGHEVSIPVVGSSMTPFLGDGRDQVFVKAPWRPIRRGDIVLYRRRNGEFVLHRVHRVHGSGESATYDVIGDAQDRIERGINKEQVFAVAARARRKGKIIEPGSFYWWSFQYIWIRIIPLRHMILRVYTVIHGNE